MLLEFSSIKTHIYKSEYIGWKLWYGFSKQFISRFHHIANEKEDLKICVRCNSYKEHHQNQASSLTL